MNRAKPAKSTRAKKGAKPAAKKAAAKTATAKKAPPVESRLPGFDTLFLPYQRRYLQDRSRFKIWEKSRRIGGTWTQSFEDVLDCIDTPGLKVWFSSADMTASAEYMDYCQDWISKLNAVARVLAEVENEDIEGLEFADEEKGFKSRVIEFANGSKIYALSSNPKAFRSKGGKIVWDEAAWHDSDAKMWAAAKPAAMWGYPIRILSTHNGARSVFNQLIGQIRAGKLKGWGHHRVTVLDAVAEGLVDRIVRRATTEEERREWLENEEGSCLTDTIWRQEYLCDPVDESSAFLPYAMISSCEREDLLGLDRSSGALYLGMDIARRRHLSVIFVIEMVGGSLFTRHIEVMQNMKFSAQRERLFAFLRHERMVRACIDSTGIGMQLSEEAVDEFGGMVEQVNFTNQVKEQIAIQLKNEFEDVSLLIPADKILKESLHSVRCIVTAANNVRYDADATDKNGHADHFWAAALAVHAARDPLAGAPWAKSSTPWKATTAGFETGGSLAGFSGASLPKGGGW